VKKLLEESEGLGGLRVRLEAEPAEFPPIKGLISTKQKGWI